MSFLRTWKTILNAVFLLIAIYMAGKVGYSSITQSSEMLSMFTPRGVTGIGLVILGILSVVSGILLFLPNTYQVGNAITIGVIMFIIIMHIKDNNRSGVVAELPFLALSVFIAILPHPLNLQ